MSFEILRSEKVKNAKLLKFWRFLWQSLGKEKIFENPLKLGQSFKLSLFLFLFFFSARYLLRYTAIRYPIPPPHMTYHSSALFPPPPSFRVGSGEDEDEEGSTELARLFACGGESGEDERGALENEEEEGGFFFFLFWVEGKRTRNENAKGRRRKRETLSALHMYPPMYPPLAHARVHSEWLLYSCVDRRDISLL